MVVVGLSTSTVLSDGSSRVDILYGVIGTSGLILKPEYRKIIPSVGSERVFTVQSKDYKYGVLGFRGCEIIPFGKYVWIDGFDHGLARVKNVKTTNGQRSNKYGIINTEGEEVVPLEFDKISNFYNKVRNTTRAVKNGVRYEIDLTTIASKRPTGNPVIDNLIHNMVIIEGGTFSMGSTEPEYSSDEERTVHTVKLSDFIICKYEVTQKEWKEIMGDNPSHFKGDNLPVECVSWNDCQEFIRKLNKKTGLKFRLPTEAEWEYAAQGGTWRHGYIYAGASGDGNDDYDKKSIDDVAWYGDLQYDIQSSLQGESGWLRFGTSDGETHDIGTKLSNELRLYDMSGNVWEWCQDWYGDYTASVQNDPKGSLEGSKRVIRGGSCRSDDFN